MTDIAAVLAVRNERPHLRNCLQHLLNNGLRIGVVDNESTDGTRELLNEAPFRDALFAYERHPFPGYFDWTGLMRARERMAAASGADWVVFVSADEIMHSYRDGETLHEAIVRVGRDEDADVIDFNEFVFLPVDHDYAPDHAGPQPMRHYYFHEPKRPRLMRARRRVLAVSHIEAGGHTFTGEYRLAEESFALRHYIFRDAAHARAKYPTRTFERSELARGWHGNRVNIREDEFVFPPSTELLRLDRPGDRNLSRKEPRKRHYWQWDQPRKLTS